MYAAAEFYIAFCLVCAPPLPPGPRPTAEGYALHNSAAFDNRCLAATDGLPGLPSLRNTFREANSLQLRSAQPQSDGLQVKLLLGSGEVDAAEGRLPRDSCPSSWGNWAV